MNRYSENCKYKREQVSVDGQTSMPSAETGIEKRGVQMKPNEKAETGENEN
jgi:hypothetical protein